MIYFVRVALAVGKHEMKFVFFYSIRENILRKQLFVFLNIVFFLVFPSLNISFRNKEKN